MGSVYKAARSQFADEQDNPIRERNFRIVLVDPRRVKFDADQESLEDILGEDGDDRENWEIHDLRTQVISDPAQSVTVRDRVLQFFAVRPSALVGADKAGVIFEAPAKQEAGEPEKKDKKKGGQQEETPLFFVNKDEMLNIAHGAGFAVPLHVEDLQD